MTYNKLKELVPEAFRRYSGVKPETFEAMLAVLERAEEEKKKAGRPSKLSLGDQLMLSLTYWREYRTQFHIASSYGVHETTATRIISKVEDALVASGRFSLPKRQALGEAEQEWVVVVLDSTETPIERPKKNSAASTAARRENTP
jgi:hypothetical protein